MENKITALEDDELENVSGGKVAEMRSDMLMLYKSGFLDKIFSPCALVEHFEETGPKIQDAWKKAGIRAECSLNGCNQYYYLKSDIPISREKAISILKRYH